MKKIILSLFIIFSVNDVYGQQKYYDALAFEGLVNGLATDLKECSVNYSDPPPSKTPDEGDVIAAVFNPLNILAALSSMKTYKFNSSGQLINAEVLGIRNIKRNAEGYITSYTKGEDWYEENHVLKYESIPLKSGKKFLRLYEDQYRDNRYRYIYGNNVDRCYIERHKYNTLKKKFELDEKRRKNDDSTYDLLCLDKNHGKWYVYKTVKLEPIFWNGEKSSSSSSSYSSNAGGTYTIQKGDVLWSVAKSLLIKSGKERPTNGEILQAMEDIAKANGCDTPDECRTKFFYDRHVGKTIKIPSYLAQSGTKTQSSSSSTVTNKPSSTTTTTPSTSSSSTYSSGSTYGNTSSRPSYNYSYKKYREPHKWVGFSIGYVQKSWASKIDGKKERYGMWEDSKFVNGVQAGIRVEPVSNFGLGLNTGLFYEYYYTESDDMYYTNGPGSYRGVIQEHALYLPVHLEYRLRFSDDFSAFIYGGAGFDYGISAGVEFKDTDDDYVIYENNSLYESEDVENWKRFNASLEYGLGLSYKNVQLNVTRSHGLVNMAKEDGYSVKQNKPLMVSLSIMF